MTQESTKIRQRGSTDIKVPKQYQIVFHNDDVTTMEFVIRVLETVFFKKHKEAEILMAKVHNEGKAVIGIYSYDIAISKFIKATSMANAESFPLKITCEPI